MLLGTAPDCKECCVSPSPPSPSPFSPSVGAQCNACSPPATLPFHVFATVSDCGAMNGTYKLSFSGTSYPLGLEIHSWRRTQVVGSSTLCLTFECRNGVAEDTFAFFMAIDDDTNEPLGCEGFDTCNYGLGVPEESCDPLNVTFEDLFLQFGDCNDKCAVLPTVVVTE